MVYIVENNGVYGLTKGQFSATADRGSKAKRGAINNDSSIDLVAMAMQLGATFVARSFSGDKDAARADHQGGDRAQGRGVHRRDLAPASRSTITLGSTKSFDYVRDAQRGGEPARLHHRPRADQGRLRAGHGRDRRAA